MYRCTQQIVVKRGPYKEEFFHSIVLEVLRWAD